MSAFLEILADLFAFIVDQMGVIAGFFTSNVIGQIILGIAVFSLVLNIVMSFVNKMK